jgi:hypothetical protein
MARGLKKIKKTTIITVLLKSYRPSDIYLRCQTRSDLESSNTRLFGGYVFAVARDWDERIYLRQQRYVEKFYKFVLDTSSNRYARGRVVFKNEDSDA